MSRGGVTDAGRMRFVQFVRKQAAEGKLSSTEVDDRVEQIFRARSVIELELAISDLPGARAISLDAAIAGDWQSKTARSGSWLRRLVIYTLVADVLGVILWATTGGGLVWLVLLFMCSLVVLVFRVSRRGQSIVGFRSRRRR